MSDAAVLPLSRGQLAGLIADVALRLTDVRQAPLRLGVDGLADVATPVADEVAAELRDRGADVVRAACAEFLRPRSLRLEWGAPLPGDLLQGWFDDDGLVREFLEPLGPGGTRRCVTGLRDAVTDRSLRRPPVAVGPRAVGILDGPFLARPGTAARLDVRLRLVRSPAALARRLAALGTDAVAGGVGGGTVAEALSELDDDGRGHGVLTVRMDDARRPALELPAGVDPARPAPGLAAHLSAPHEPEVRPNPRWNR